MAKPENVVLIIDDEPQIRQFLRAGFELQDFRVREAASAAAGLELATLYPPDLIILDLCLPDQSGAEVLERIRSWSNVPVIVISIEADEQVKVRLLELGADDYVVKPFGMAELLARGEAALRRYSKPGATNPVVKTGPLTIDLASRTATLDSNRISFTRKEYLLLHMLASNLGRVVTHRQLLDDIWGKNLVHNVQYLRVLVRKVRRKIELDPNRPTLVLAASGVGYRLESRSDETDRPDATSEMTPPRRPRIRPEMRRPPDAA